ncbi:Ig-like domain-containing protein [Tenacibaculum tangerinum]|uniref:Ig-like domain-containing protein n=1 Tax=Tenacibaculum tangerinum TaxID=3038772 RepID=A0ABY8L9V5_9FLAO|nr:Ig-like domain-containing protein [Tenacibaculum tangerinum]WGH76933.1 Ig-like domain-containing protein [Tenacibaculum tangerinum]
MKKLITLLIIIFLNQTMTPQTVSSWLTLGDESQKLTQQSDVSFVNDDGLGTNVIDLNPNNTYQSLDGFGFMLTQGSAEVLMSLNSTVRTNLLKELYDPSNNAVSIVRISIGASDLSNSVYTYNDTPGDVNMTNFSLAGPDQTYLIPVLKEILSINPNIKILATPWTAPIWMKTNPTWIGDRLDTQYYAAYALYFIKYLDAMKAQGIDIWAITPQNEPLNTNNEPSMFMSENEQINLINNHLGPAIVNAGYNTKIIAYDHNCDNPRYPTKVLNSSPYVDGAAFHLYDRRAQISAMSQVKEDTGKNVYFTEQYTGANGSFGGDLNWHLKNVVIGSTRNWSKTVIEWNLATDTEYGPRTPGGCDDCLGAITVGNDGVSFTRNVSYYIISHISKFVQPNAERIESNITDIQNVAFLNPDNTISLITLNDSGGSSSFRVRIGGKSFSYTLPNGAVASFKWSIDGTPVGNNAPLVALTSPSNGASFTPSSDILLSADASDSDGSVTQVNFYEGTTLLGSDTTSPYSYTWSNVAQGNYTITAEAVDNEGATTVSNPISISVQDATSNNPPTVALTSPTNGSSFVAGSNINVTADASDSDGTITQVNFYSGTNLLGSDTTSPYSFTWNNVSEGNYTLTAEAIDNNGATTVSNSASITVQNTTGQGPAMYVSNVTLGTSNGKNKKGTAQVLVLDENGNTVSSATVTGTFSGDYSQTVTGNTGPGGIVNFSTSSTTGDPISFTFCVDNITHQSLTYNSSLNTITCNSYSSVSGKAASQDTILTDTTYSIYKNSRNELILKSPFKDSVEVNIFSILGKKVKTLNYDKGIGEFIVNTTGLSNGIYIVNINSDREVVSKKVLINN